MDGFDLAGPVYPPDAVGLAIDDLVFSGATVAAPDRTAPRADLASVASSRTDLAGVASDRENLVSV